MSAYRELWFCDPGASIRKCRSVPCHGHRATRDQYLVARVQAWVEGRDWDDVFQSELRVRLRRAWILLVKIRGRAPEEGA